MADANSDQLDAAMQENAATAQAITTRDGSVTSQSLDSQIKYDRYRAAKAALNGGLTAFDCMRPRKMIPPSSIGQRCGGGP